MDAATLNVIEKGKRNVEILKQSQNDPFKVEDQIAIIYAGTKNLLKEVPVDRIKDFEIAYINELNKSHKKVLESLKEGVLNDNIFKTLGDVCLKISNQFK